MLRFDDESSRRVEAAYLTPDVVAQRRGVREWLALRPGERVLDVGVGPGFLAAEMADEVGPDGTVAGIDVSESMLALARNAERGSTCGPGRSPTSRTRMPVSTPRCPHRSSSTSRTSRRRSSSCAGSYARVVGS